MRTLPKSTFSGELIRPGDPAYDQARRVWNAAFDRRPACIVRCASSQDVVSAIEYARRAGLAVAVRGGGHHFAGLAVWDGALVVDLSPMKVISVDADRRTAVVQPGVTWGELDAATTEHGLATTGTDLPAVGIAGSTLAGGLGWLHRVAGLSCDNLLSAEVVTADGAVLRAAADEQPDLFWALRGGSGNFGVVTSFEYRLHPVTEVYGGMLLYPIELAGEALRLYQELCDWAPDELFLRATLTPAPPAPFVPEAVRGRPCALFGVAYFGAPAEGEQALRPLRELGSPLVDLVQPLSYSALQQLLAGAVPPEIRAYARTEWLTRLIDEVIDALVAGAANPPSPSAMINLQQLGGAMSRVPDAETAFGYRHADHHLGVLGIWPPAAQGEPVVDWVRSIWELARPVSAGGGYIGNLMDEGEDRLRASYGAPYSRLARIKARYDPENFFRINPNIAPDPGE